MAKIATKWLYKYISFIIYLSIILTIYLAPSVPDKTTAALDIDRLLIPREEWPESFGPYPIVKDLIREIPDYIPMDIPSKEGKPQNIDLSIHWNPLRVFLLFFSFPVLQIICDSTNSFALRNHTAKDPWKTLQPIELLHYFGNLILIGLFGQPPRKYAWKSRNGYLRDTPISKNRFE